MLFVTSSGNTSGGVVDLRAFILRSDSSTASTEVSMRLLRPCRQVCAACAHSSGLCHATRAPSPHGVPDCSCRQSQLNYRARAGWSKANWFAILPQWQCSWIQPKRIAGGHVWSVRRSEQQCKGELPQTKCSQHAGLAWHIIVVHRRTGRPRQQSITSEVAVLCMCPCEFWRCMMIIAACQACILAQFCPRHHPRQPLE